MILYGTDFYTSKKIGKVIKKSQLEGNFHIRKIDYSHHLLSFDRTIDALNFLESHRNDSYKEEMYVEEGFLKNRKSFFGIWMKLWTYKYFNRDFTVEARFRGNTEALPIEERTENTIIYQKIKKRLLEEFRELAEESPRNPTSVRIPMDIVQPSEHFR